MGVRPVRRSRGAVADAVVMHEAGSEPRRWKRRETGGAECAASGESGESPPPPLEVRWVNDSPGRLPKPPPWATA
eukprot:4488225-Prymnesium_polylepis.1